MKQDAPENPVGTANNDQAGNEKYKDFISKFQFVIIQSEFQEIIWYPD